MVRPNEEVVEKGVFEGVAYSRAKKNACDRGELVLTSKNLEISCQGNWSKVFSVREIRVEALNRNLEIYDFWYHRLLFKLIMDDAEKWARKIQNVTHEYLENSIEWFWGARGKKNRRAKEAFRYDS